LNNFSIAVRNDLILASYTLTITEKRLLLCFISKIPMKRELNSITLQKLDIKQYASLFNVQPKHALADIKKALITLPNRTVYLRRDEPFKDTVFNWISKETMFLDDGYTLGIRWSEEVIQYISELKWFFLTLKLDEVKNLSSFYALRLYELIRCELGEKPKEIPYFTIEDIRFLLDIDEKKHLTTTNLTNSLMKPAIKAINRDTTMVVVMEPYKRERKIIGFRFKVTKT
jgi:plasmid replication initiation protein